MKRVHLITTRDFADIRGQEAVKRALLIALAGGHSITLIGPTGNGKSMLIEAARAILPGILAEEITIPSNREGWSFPPVVSDMQCEVPKVTYRDFTGKRRGTDSAYIRGRLENCGKFTDLSLTDSCLLLAKQAWDELAERINPRTFNSMVRVARTIGNLEGAEKIGEMHLAEAIQYRLL